MGKERWNTSSEIRRHFKENTAPDGHAGVVLFAENGKIFCDDSEAHIAAIGRTGKGKSACASKPFLAEIAAHGESAIVLDPKGEMYQDLGWRFDGRYQKFCVNFRNPRTSPTKWNPLHMPYRLFSSGDPDDRDFASSLLSEFWTGVYPESGDDPFWAIASRNYGRGLTYALFEMQNEKHVNMDSLSMMMEQSEIGMGGSGLISEFWRRLPNGALSKRNLSTYVTGPSSTRASIHSVAEAGMEVFSRSRGLMEMLAQDTLDILNLDVSRPFVLFVVLPDESDAYDLLAGLLVSQLSQFLIRRAQDLGGRLPVRVNMILEELGSIGRSIPSLPNLMVAGRSRNLRLMLVYQSAAQLVDVYGHSKAETINSCIGITIGFSTNSFNTLQEWSVRCGERQSEKDSGGWEGEKLITPTQLAAMPTGTALILADSRYKFVSHLPFFHEMYDNSGWHEPEFPAAPPAENGPETFDMESWVKKQRTEEIKKRMEEKKKKEEIEKMEKDKKKKEEIKKLMEEIKKFLEEVNKDDEDDDGSE